jgi:hypothetical protein
MSSVVMAVAKAAGEGWMAEKEWRGSKRDKRTAQGLSDVGRWQRESKRLMPVVKDEEVGFVSYEQRFRWP